MIISVRFPFNFPGVPGRYRPWDLRLSLEQQYTLCSKFVHTHGLHMVEVAFMPLLQCQRFLVVLVRTGKSSQRYS